MATLTLDEFIGVNRKELIRRCRAKVVTRSSPPPTDEEIYRGVPLFLDQLAQELRESSQTQAINQSAVQHGRDLWLGGFTVGQVVHDYGDVCQSITDLAVESKAPISNEEFRTLNRCLDDAIAGAVTEYEHAQDDTLEGELLTLTNTAIAAFEALRSGTVGVGGSTAAVVHRTLLAIRDCVARQRTGPPPAVAV